MQKNGQLFCNSQYELRESCAEQAPAHTVLITELLSAENDAIVYSSFELLATPAAMMSALPKAAVTASVGAPRAAGKGAKSGIFFLSFPYVCPETVLAK
jgi:hypothetical protein